MYIHEAMQASLDAGVRITRKSWYGDRMVFAREDEFGFGIIRVTVMYTRTEEAVEYHPSYRDYIADDWEIVTDWSSQ